MKKLILFFLFLYFNQIYSQEIIKKHYSFIPGEKANLKIELDGEMILTSWDLPYAQVDIENEITGFYFAIGNQSQWLKNYDIQICNINGNIEITANKREGSSFSFGISTLRSKIKHSFYLPKALNLIVNSKEADITVFGNFNNLDIANKKGNCKLAINEKNIKFVECENPDGKINVDNVNYINKFRKFGDGQQLYSVVTQSGEIYLNLINN